MAFFATGDRDSDYLKIDAYFKLVQVTDPRSFSDSDGVAPSGVHLLAGARDPRTAAESVGLADPVPGIGGVTKVGKFRTTWITY